MFCSVLLSTFSLLNRLYISTVCAISLRAQHWEGRGEGVGEEDTDEIESRKSTLQIFVNIFP